MAARLRLETFDLSAAPPAGAAGAPAPAAAAAAAGEVAGEEARLEAFEAGYKAGWEDAVAAAEDDQGRLRADLARNLQALSFTYHEARGHVLQGLAPLLREAVGRVLPVAARGAIGALVAETLRPIAERCAGAPVTVLVSPASRAAVEAALALEPGLPVAIVEEPTLGAGQVYLRFGGGETLVDLDGATAAIAAAVEDYFHPEEEASRRHG